jgi:hypothetical protein
MFLSFGSFSYFLVMGKGGLRDCYFLRYENEKLGTKIQQIKGKKDRLQKKVVLYKQDHFAREKLVRKELLMGRGELVYLN